jgi:hypothetical protein
LIGVVLSGNYLIIMSISKTFITYPWENISEDNKGNDYVGLDSKLSWHFQVSVDCDTKVVNAATGKAFPEHQTGDNKKIVELSGPSIKGDMSKSITLEIDDSEMVMLSFSNEGKANSNFQTVKLFESFFDTTMNAILFFSRECLKVEKFKVETIYWPNILTEFNKKDKDDPAKYSLVVDLARSKELFSPLKRITDRPKKVLRRIHDQERIQKVQEVDTRCLIDLARRPGTVIVEKAGPKQRILAIKRTESIDILENRVAKHCCRLASIASKRYLREHEDIALEASPRKSLVTKLARSSYQLPLKNSFQGVSKLTEPCRQPNYTLMQNADYYKVWKAYIQLVRNEDLRQELWKWNRRMWSDLLGLYLTQLLTSYQETMTDSHIQLIAEKTVRGTRRQFAGKWLVPDTLPGPYIINKESKQPGTLFLINGDYETLLSVSPSLSDLAVLNADYLFLISKGGQKSVLPVYALFPSNHLDEHNYSVFVQGILPSLIKSTRLFKKRVKDIEIVGSWVLLGNWGNIKIDEIPKNNHENISTWITCVNSNCSMWKNDIEDDIEPLMTICGV